MTVRQIVVASDAPPRISALAKKDGQATWTMNNPLGALSNPILWNNLLVLFPNSSALQAINPDSGELLWQLGPPFPPPISEKSDREELSAAARILARPVRSGGKLLCLRGDGAIVEVSGSKGAHIAVKLESPLRDDIFVARPAALGGRLWACTRRGYLQAVNPENGEIFYAQFLTPTPRSPITANLLTMGETVVIASEDGTVYSINPGHPKEGWQFQGEMSCFSVSGDLLLTPQSAGPDLCLLTTLHQLCCLGPKGQVRWRRSWPAGMSARPHCRQLAPTGAGATGSCEIFVTTEDSKLLQLSAQDGSITRSWQLPCAACAEPAADDEDVFVALKDRTVRAYSLEASPRTKI